MNGVDSLLRMAIQNAADELRLGTDEAPRMLQKGRALRLSIPETPAEMLRLLLGSILDGPREAELARAGQVELDYTPDGGEPFVVTLSRRGGKLEALFKRGARARP